MRSKILFLASNPARSGKLALDREFHDIAEGLKLSKYRDRFELEPVLAVRPRDIRRALLDHRPTMVHFAGHGVGNGTAGDRNVMTDSSSLEGILVEGHAGGAQVISGESLGSLFELFSDHVTCVVFNACYSEAQAKAVIQHIPHVIGMRSAISDAAAIEFSVAFYDAIGAGKDISFAYKLACNAIQIAGLPEEQTPVHLNREQSAGSALPERVEVPEALIKVFIMWTIDGSLKEDADQDGYAMAAFNGLLADRAVDSPATTMRNWIELAKREASEALGRSKSVFDYLEFDIAESYEPLQIEESFFRLWRIASTKRDAATMAGVRLALIAYVGEDRQRELIGAWTRRT